MRLIKPFTAILSKVDGNEILGNIELAGRTCYKSEDKMTDDSAEKFVQQRIMANGHESVLEHEKVTVRFVVDRGVSHELVRHRIASFSQESTRYCNYSKGKYGGELTFIIPCWIDDITRLNQPYDETENRPERVWYNSLLIAERSYNHLIKAGWSPQQARSVLPNSLKTEIVVTANLREWRLIFKQRTSIKAHPQMREVMIPLLEEFKGLIPVIFNDIMKKKTSEEWGKNYPVTIVNPDGWDRKNWQYSWFEEVISFEEFEKRVFHSTTLQK